MSKIKINERAGNVTEREIVDIVVYTNAKRIKVICTESICDSDGFCISGGKEVVFMIADELFDKLYKDTTTRKELYNILLDYAKIECPQDHIAAELRQLKPPSPGMAVDRSKSI